MSSATPRRLAYQIARKAIEKHGRTHFTLHVQPPGIAPDATVKPEDLIPVALEVVGALNVHGDHIRLVCHDHADDSSMVQFQFTFTGAGLEAGHGLVAQATLASRLDDRRSRLDRAMLKLIDTEGTHPIVDIITAWHEHTEQRDAPMGESFRRGAALIWGATNGLRPDLCRALRDQAGTSDVPVSELGRALIAATTC